MDLLLLNDAKVLLLTIVGRFINTFFQLFLAENVLQNRLIDCCLTYRLMSFFISC